MKKILIIAPKAKTLENFRGDLIREMVRRNFEVIAIAPEPKADVSRELIKLKKFTYIELPMDKNSVSILHDLKYKQRIEEILSKYMPDIVFSYTSKPVIYGTIASSKHDHIKVYPMITGLGYAYTENSIKTLLLRFILNNLYRYSLKKANKVIFQNEDDRNLFIKKRIIKEENSLVVNGSGVDIDKFSLKKPNSSLKFIMVGRLLETKGVREYIEASYIIKKQFPESKISLVGAYTEMQSKVDFKLVDKAVKTGTIEYYGEVENILPILHEHSIFVLPSYREGVPRSAQEAMSVGLPIITTDVPGCRDVVVDGYNGILIESKNVDSLVQAMKYYCENSIKVIEHGLNSRKMVKEKFDVDRINEQMMKVFMGEI